MKNKKLKLTELDVNSFVTKLQENDMPTVIGASISAKAFRALVNLWKKVDDIPGHTMDKGAKCREIWSQIQSCPGAALCNTKTAAEISVKL